MARAQLDTIRRHRDLKVISAAELLAMDLPPQEDIVGHGLMPKGELSMLAGLFKSGKTNFALQMALSITQGAKFLDFNTVKTRTLFLSGEGGPYLLRERLGKMTANVRKGLDDLRLFWPCDVRIDLAKEESIKLIANYCLGNNIGLIIIDPLIKFNSLDENSTREMGQLVRRLSALRFETRAAIFLVHHARKPNRYSGNNGVEARGSTVLQGDVDSLMMLKSRRSKGDYILQFELRHAEEPEPMQLTLDTKSLCYINGGPAQPNRKMVKERIFEIVGKEAPCSKKQIAQITNRSERTVQKYLVELEEQGVVQSMIVKGSKGMKHWRPVK